ncbi:MAG: hypothetical protein IPK98_11090 [Chloracidobacterium sp.]|nr:hypothetical protein [Chloracidobacterium sp.]
MLAEEPADQDHNRDDKRRQRHPRSICGEALLFLQAHKDFEAPPPLR